MLWTLLILVFIFANALQHDKAARKPTNYENMFLMMDFMDSEDEGL